MSYCGFSSGQLSPEYPECDVYMYPHIAGHIECCGCSLAPEGQFSMEFATRKEALAHLQAHRDAGDEVPEYAFERLRQEIAVQEAGLMRRLLPLGLLVAGVGAILGLIWAMLQIGGPP